MSPRRFFTRRAVVTSVILGILGLTVLFFALNTYTNEKGLTEVEIENGVMQAFKAVTFTISGKPITLEAGMYTFPTTQGAESVRTVRYFGNEVQQDIDSDGDLDTVFLVTDDGGGSGTFFYVVGSIKQPNGYIGTEAMFLGDRIAPQTTEKGEGAFGDNQLC